MKDLESNVLIYDHENKEYRIVPNHIQKFYNLIGENEECGNIDRETLYNLTKYMY